MLYFVTKANKESNKRHRKKKEEEEKKSEAVKSKFSFLILKHNRMSFLDLIEWLKNGTIQM
jgi:hypothetical protein